jgi:hypothetical protein
MTDVAQEPSGFRWCWFAQHLRYSFRHSHFSSLHQSSRSGFSALERSPTISNTMLEIHGFGKMLEPRYVIGARALDQ